MRETTMVTSERFEAAVEKAMEFFGQKMGECLSCKALDELQHWFNEVQHFVEEKQQVTFLEYLECVCNAWNNIEGDGDMERYDREVPITSAFINMTAKLLREGSV